MARTVIAGALVAVLAALVAAVGNALGITTFWPLLLAAAVGLAPGRFHVGRVGAYVLGLIFAFVTMAVQAGLLPSSALARGGIAVVAVAVLTAVAVVTSGRLPFWAGLGGYATFVGFYEPLYAANPTHFLSEAPVAFTTVLLAGAIGMTAAVLARYFGQSGDSFSEQPGAQFRSESTAEVAEGGVA